MTMTARKVRRRNRRLSLIPVDSLLPTLPPAPLVGLPIGHLESPRFTIGPNPPRRRQRVVIVAVEDQHHPLVAVGVGRQRRIVDQEPDIRPVRVPLLDREDDGLVLRVAGAPGGVRQERIRRCRSTDARRARLCAPAMSIARPRANRAPAIFPARAATRSRATCSADGRTGLPSSGFRRQFVGYSKATSSLRNALRPAGPAAERRSPTPNCG